jgi:SAM-dependent methyltransferase
MQDGFAQEYGELQKWHWWFRGRQRIVESVLRLKLIDGASRNILSVGCGPAEGLNWLVPFAGKGGKVVGLDAELIHARGLSGVDFIVGRLENAPLENSSFDVVLTLDVLEHLDDDASGLREAVRLLKPGGLLLITVPALPSLWGGQDIVSEHRRRYTRRSLERLLNEAGLENYRTNYFNAFLFPLIAMIRWGRRVIALEDRARMDFDNQRPGMLNDALAWVFALERHVVNHVSIPIGVSLIATHSPSLNGGLPASSESGATVEQK